MPTNPAVRKTAEVSKKVKPASAGYGCPECKANLRAYIAPEKFAPGKYLICPKCAAIVMVDQANQPRACLTQEVLDLVYAAGNHDFFDERLAIIERITAPA